MTAESICQNTEFQCENPTHRKSALCPECIKDLWPACVIEGYPDYILAWKGLRKDRTKTDVYLGAKEAPYRIGAVFATFGITNFFLSALGAAKQQYGKLDGVFVARLSDCHLREDSVINSFSPVMLLEVRERRLTKEEMSKVFEEMEFSALTALEMSLRPEVPSTIELPDDLLVDTMVGYVYSGLKNPVHPFCLPPPSMSRAHRDLLWRWRTYLFDRGLRRQRIVARSVKDTLAERLGKWSTDWSLGESQDAYKGKTPLGSCRDEVMEQVSVSLNLPLHDIEVSSVQAAIAAYIGSHFPSISKWEYIEHEEGRYLFQPAVDLWHEGIVPSFDGQVWRLHASNGDGTCRIAWESV